MRIGLESIVLHLGDHAGRGRARAALREAVGRGADVETTARDALFTLGVDLVETTYGPSDSRAPIIVFGDQAVLLERPRERPFLEAAALAGHPNADSLPAALVVPRRPLQALAGRSTWGRIAALVSMERSELWTILVYAIAIGLTTLATPIAVQTMFDVVAFGTLLQPIVVVASILLAVLVFSGLLRVLESVAVELMSRRLFVRAATDFAHRIPVIDRTELSAKELREKVTRFFDAAIAEKSLGLILMDGVTGVLQIAVGMTLLAFYHPVLLAFDFVLVVGVVIVVFPLGRNAASTAIAESKQKYRLAAWLRELASVPHAFGSVTGIRQADTRADDLLAEWLDARKRQFSIQLRQFAGMIALQIGASVGLLAIGGALVVGRQLTLGQLVAAELVMSVTVASLAKLGKLFGKVYDLVASLGKLAEVVDLPLRPERGESLPAGGAASLTLDDAFDIEPGERVAVVGAPHEFTRLMDGVHVDGRRCRDLDPFDVHEQVEVLCRDGLFDGDVLDNLTIADSGVTHAVARQALEGAGARDLAANLSRPVGPQGARLDRVERARLLVARALVRPPRVVVVDRLFDGVGDRHVAEMTEILRGLSDTTVVCLTELDGVAARFDRVIRIDANREAA